MNGVHANYTANVDDDKDIGQGIFASVTGKFVTEFAFKRSNQESGCDSCYKVIR